MTRYVVIRGEREYVAKPGSEHSYTKRLEEAKVYFTRSEAEADRCPGNERIATLAEVMGIDR